MKNRIITSLVLGIVFIGLSSFSSGEEKMVSKKTHVKFFSSTPAEDIEANNYKSVSTVDPSTGAVVFSLPMQSFEFEKSMMQKHFNSPDFLDTQAHPKAKLVATITNLAEINFKKDGTYLAEVSGEMTIHGETNPIKEKATINIKNGVINVTSTFNIELADYKIAFEKGKPSTNIAKTVAITAIAEFALND